jgi:hypothetical protein
LGQDTQTERGRLFEILADITDEDGALAEMEDLESLDNWLYEVDQQLPQKNPRQQARTCSIRRHARSCRRCKAAREKGLNAIAQVKFFTSDSNWTWYASEFDGEDTFFGLVSGFEVELGYFSLKELQEVKGPLGLQIERDIYFEPQTLGRLIEIHKHEKED